MKNGNNYLIYMVKNNLGFLGFIYLIYNWIKNTVKCNNCLIAFKLHFLVIKMPEILSSFQDIDAPVTSFVPFDKLNAINRF